eukprot:338610-Hanusia_phi.AAC.2
MKEWMAGVLQHFSAYVDFPVAEEEESDRDVEIMKRRDGENEENEENKEQGQGQEQGKGQEQEQQQQQQQQAHSFCWSHLKLAEHVGRSQDDAYDARLRRLTPRLLRSL